MPASETKPGKTTLTPDAVSAHVLAQALAEAAQAELRGGVHRRARAAGLAAEARDEHEWPLRRAAMRGARDVREHDRCARG
jgi:hypothetical protein